MEELNQQPEIEKQADIEHQPVPKNDFSFDVLKLVGGTTIAQVVGILASPVIARLFSPADFGLAANFTSIVMILSVFVCLRYELTIMLPKTRDEAANQFGVSVLSVIVISLISLPLLWFSKGLIQNWLNAPDLVPYFGLISITVLLTGVFQALNYWNTRSRQFLRLSAAQITRSVAEFGSKIVVGLAGFASGGSMIMTTAFGQAVSSLVLGWQILKDDGEFLWRNIRLKPMLEGAKRYKKFPIYNTWAALFNTFSQQLPTFLLTAYFSTTVAGHYNMGYKILRLPMALIGTSIAQVFFQRASKARHDGTLARLVEDTSHRLIVYGLFPMMLLTVSGQEIFIVAFGERWAEAGLYSQILSIWTFFVLISSPMSTLMSVLEKNEFSLVFTTILFITRFMTLFIGGLMHNAIVGLVLYSVTGSLSYLYLQFYLSNLAGVPIKRSVWLITSNIFYSSPFLFLVGIAKWLSSSNPLVVTVVSGLVGIAYYVSLYFTEPTVKEAAQEILQRFRLRRVSS